MYAQMKHVNVILFIYLFFVVFVFLFSDLYHFITEIIIKIIKYCPIY